MEALAKDLSLNNPIVYKMGHWKVREIKNEAGAKHYGKDRGWCTANDDGFFYKNTYSQEKGRLFLLYKGKKQRPRAQLFLSHATKLIELKKSHNQYYSVADLEKEADLEHWLKRLDYISRVQQHQERVNNAITPMHMGMDFARIEAGNIEEAPSNVVEGSMFMDHRSGNTYIRIQDAWALIASDPATIDTESARS